MARDRSLSGPLVASFVLHVGILGFGIVAGMLAPPLKPITVTPVTLLTSDELAKLMKAAQSKEPQTALADEPEPQAPPEAPAPPSPPEPQPKATPPPPAPVVKAPSPLPKPAEKTPAEKAPAPKAQPKASPEPKIPPSKPVDLNALAKSIQSSSPAGPPRSAAPKGPSRAELDLQAREIAEGQARAIRQFNVGIGEQLGRAWRPNCGVEGASSLRIQVRISLARDGRLMSAELPQQGDPNLIRDPVLKAAALRALSAVAASSPYRNLPPVESYDQWKTLLVVFDGRTACS